MAASAAAAWLARRVRCRRGSCWRPAWGWSRSSRWPATRWTAPSWKPPKATCAQRLKSYALAYAARAASSPATASSSRPTSPPEPRFERPGSGLYAEVVLPNGHWDSPSAQGPVLPDRRDARRPREERFEGPLPITADQRPRRRGLPLRLRPGLGADGEPQRGVPVHHLHPRRHHARSSRRSACSAARCGATSAAPGWCCCCCRCWCCAGACGRCAASIDELKRVQRGAAGAHERAPSARTRTAHRKHQRLHRERAREPRPPAQHAGRPRAQPEDAAGGAARAPGRPDAAKPSCARKSTRSCGA